MILSGAGGRTTLKLASITLSKFKIGDCTVLVCPDVPSHLRNRPGVVCEINIETMRIRFDDTGDVSPGFFFHRFRPTEPEFSVKVHFTTKDFDEAINLASTLARAGGHAVGVVNVP